MCNCCVMMCAQCMQTIVCMWQALMRLILNLCLMIENLFRLIFNSIYNLISFLIQLLTLIPLCCIFCLTSKIGCCGSCCGGSSCSSLMGSNQCTCIVGILLSIITYIILSWLGVTDIIMGWLGYKVVKYEEDELDNFFALIETTTATIAAYAYHASRSYATSERILETTEPKLVSASTEDSTKSIVDMIELLRRKLNTRMPLKNYERASAHEIATPQWTIIKRVNTPKVNQADTPKRRFKIVKNRRNEEEDYLLSVTNKQRSNESTKMLSKFNVTNSHFVGNTTPIISSKSRGENNDHDVPEVLWSESEIK